MKKWLSLILCLIMVLAMIPAGQAVTVQVTGETKFEVNGGETKEISSWAMVKSGTYWDLVCEVEDESLLTVVTQPRTTSTSYRYISGIQIGQNHYFKFTVKGLKAGETKVYVWNKSKSYKLWTGTITVVGNAFIDMKDATIEPIEDQVYTGKEIKPAVVVKDGNRTMTEGTDYKLTFEKNKDVGIAKVTAVGLGENTGRKEVTFNIVPKAPKLSGPKAAKKQLTIKWKQVKGVSGYQVEYSLNEDFSGAKKKNVNGAATLTLELKKLKSKKVYYVRVRAFQKVGKKTLYSPWSNVKSKKTK